MIVLHHHVEIDNLLRNLWELEDDKKRKLTKEEANEEEMCEKIYKENYSRSEDGRYKVKLPFKLENPRCVEGNTQEIAARRLEQLERRFEKNTYLKEEYTKVIEEYIQLQHIQEVPENEIDNPAVYLPHHAVIKQSSDTTRVRVVFDASSRADNNISLNDELLIGSQIQEDMRSLVMRWRLKRIGFVAVIQQMFRQILVTEDDTDFQRILWRNERHDPMKHYRILRVTFGTASAPYLAVRTLQQVAEDEGEKFPTAAKTIKEDFFMNDLLSGQDTVEEAIETAHDISVILKAGGFHLQKWSSNSIEFLKEFNINQLSAHVNLDINVGGTVRTLGLFWNIGEDTLNYNIDLPILQNKIIKRSILAETQHLFDPLGWLAPVLLPAKLIIQKLWLLKHVSEATRIPADKIFAWTDSTIVLSWLSGDPGRWQTFVRNRVVTILDNIGAKWFHVKSEQNPADVASRGILASELLNHKLWWQGPEWLNDENFEMMKPEIINIDLEKREKVNVNTKIINEERDIYSQFSEFDTLHELKRCIVLCKRFLNSKRNKPQIHTSITPSELEKALDICVKVVQARDFAAEEIIKTSRIKNLNPFLDTNGVLRVGGRLRHALIHEDLKHPIILEHSNPLANLIIIEAHKRSLHGGVQLTMNTIYSRYWILRLKSLVTTIIHRCIICARQRAVCRTQLMGDLPRVRVTPARPFLHSGVDFAGPLQILMYRGRGAKCNKAYICIFICMATKAIHLELEGDLSSNAFISAFKRFVARRGRCSHIWSDQGTNFVGANKELGEMWRQAGLDIPGDIVDSLTEDGTQWHFNPPYSPNFGGLWEAGVKSVKYHLRRILNTNLTFEEMSTTLCEIEACLNSRPLCPIDCSDSDNLNILTPGHFLIGEAPINVPEPDIMNININRLSHWQHTQRLKQDFWHRWQSEYLTRLQQRPKWLSQKKEFQLGDVVLVKEENLPPGKWMLGRIVMKHPGADNICRVYSVKCCGKIIKRSISKLCYLPINE